jgi:hypothetical protein
MKNRIKNNDTRNKLFFIILRFYKIRKHSKIAKSFILSPPAIKNRDRALSFCVFFLLDFSDPEYVLF